MGAGWGDRARILACFDETSAAVFATLCRLLAGDTERALDALVRTYRSLEDADGEPLDVAARVFLATAPPAGGIPASAAATLSPIERAAAELSLVRHLSAAEIASAVHRPVDEVSSALARAVEALSTEGGQAVEALRHGEVWFDDAMRRTARQQLEDRVGADESTPALWRHSHRRTNALVGLGSAVVGAALVIWVSAAKRDDFGNALPIPPPTVQSSTTISAETSTTTRPGVVASGTISSIGAGTTTQVTTSVSAATPSTAPVGFVLDPVPDGFAAVDGMDLETDGGPRTSWQAVWSSDGATRTSGRWFTVALTDDQTTLRLSPGTPGDSPVLRFALAGRDMQLFADADGVQHASTRLTSGRLMEFVSFGVSVEEIATLAGATTVGDDGSVSFGADSAAALEGLSLRAATPVGGDVLLPFGFLREDFAAWYGPADGETLLLVSSGVQQPNDLLTASLLLAPSTDVSAPVLPYRTVDVSGHAALVGEWDSGFGRTLQVVMWHQGGRTIMVRGTVSLDIALQAARAARPASLDEWRALLDTDAPLNSSSPPSQGALNSAQIGSIITRAGSTWIVGLNDAQLYAGGDERQSDGAISVAEVRPGSGDSSADPTAEQWFPLRLDPAQPLTHFESLDATVLVVALSQPTDAAFMRVTVGDSKRVDVPIIAVPDTVLAGGAYAFSEIAPFAVELLDAYGAVLQTLTP